jgi:hypothetical protein
VPPNPDRKAGLPKIQQLTDQPRNSHCGSLLE